MSNRSLLEFNHDYCPHDTAGELMLGHKLHAYMRGADPDELPPGVRRIDYRHHSDPTLWDAAQKPYAVLAAIVGAYADALPAEVLERARATLNEAGPVLRRGVWARSGR